MAVQRQAQLDNWILELRVPNLRPLVAREEHPCLRTLQLALNVDLLRVPLLNRPSLLAPDDVNKLRRRT